MPKPYMKPLSMLLLACSALFFSTLITAQEATEVQKKPRITLFENVKVLDGTGNPLSEAMNVLVEGNKIAKISAGPIPTKRSANVTLIDGKGQTLMPGLIDAHWHTMMATMPMTALMNSKSGYVNLFAAKGAKETLMRGFTSVRDLAGPVFSLKRSIDEGLVDGPRIWPSGAMISQTGGHGDFRTRNDIPAPYSRDLYNFESMNGGAIADGVPEVLQRAREQLTLGASQVKLAAGGGVSSSFDPIDVSQFLEEELRAAVKAAENWGTYVTVHAYTPRAIQTALRAGVMCIDHGQMIDEETAKMIAEKGAWLSLQPFLDDEDAIPFPEGSENRAKQLKMVQGTDKAYELAQKHNLKVAWGTDTLFDPKLATRQGAQLAKMTRWFEPMEIIKMATSTNAELLALSGERAPYKGKLGVVKEGALADLLLVKGNPVENIDLIADPANNMLVIMKDGQVYKNIVAQADIAQQTKAVE